MCVCYILTRMMVAKLTVSKSSIMILLALLGRKQLSVTCFRPEIIFPCDLIFDVCRYQFFQEDMDFIPFIDLERVRLLEPPISTM